MLTIKKINMGIVLFGNRFYFKYLAQVKEDSLTNTFIPIGREIKYVINSMQYVTYQNIPIIIYHKYHKIEIMEEKKMTDLMIFFYRKMEQLQIKQYKEDGIKIEYIEENAVINWDPRIITLVRGKTPKQDHVRALIDISDQLFDHNPRADVQIIFYIKGHDIINANLFYIQQIDTFMEFKYDEKDLYFFNNVVGYFKYNMITGNIRFVLVDTFTQDLFKKFMLNYPNAKPMIEIYVMAIQPDVNYRSIIYN